MTTTEALASLTKGYVFPAASFALSESDADAYLDAVGDRAFRALGATDRLPPLATAALALRSLLAGFSLPAGAVHTGEELEFVRPVRPGEPLRCDSAVVQASDRQGYRFATIEQRVVDGAGAPVLIARAAVMAPLEPGNGPP